jgi:hypothetical protein
MAPESAISAEFRIQPGLTLGEEYNDNIFLTPRDRSSDFISRVAPSIDIVYNVPLWDWNVNAFYEYRYYSRYHNYINQNNIPSLNLTNHTRIKDEHMFLDVRENYSRTSLTPTRDYTQESAFINQTDRNILTVNPYFITRPTSRMTVTTGYSYSNIWYKNPTAIDQTNNSVYTGFQQDMSRRSSMLVGIRHTQNRNSGRVVSGLGNVVTSATTTVLGYTQDDVFLGQRYEYVENSTLYVQIGNSWFHSKDAERVSQVTWDANLTHRYSTMTVIYETGLRFIPDPYRVSRREDRYLATLRRDVERTSLAASGGLYEYRNIKDKHLQQSRYFVNGMMSHSITTKTKVILDFEVDWYKDYLTYTSYLTGARTETERYMTGARFEYLAAETMTLALGYRYTNVYSPDVYSDNYFNNRYTVELRMVF